VGGLNLHVMEVFGDFRRSQPSVAFAFQRSWLDNNFAVRRAYVSGQEGLG
jgi:hypothetical protein